jgi:ribosomal protein S17E
MKKYFFGWENIKWLVRELGEMYSSRKSFFSKKRIESGLAFIIGQWGMIFFLLENHAKMTTSDLVLWSGVEFLIAGYTTHQIQKEKKNNENEG